MITRTNAILAAFVLALSSGALAQNISLGPVGNWEDGSADVAIMGQDGPEPVGNIAGDGMITLALPANSEAGRPLADLFFCNTGGEVSISLADAALTPSGLAVVKMAEEEFIGELLAFSSAEYGTAWLRAMSSGSSPDMPGASYRLIYTADPVTVTGRCATDFLVDGGEGTAVKQVSDYDINFTAGWNLLKTDTSTTVTSKLGMTFPLDIRMESTPVTAAEVYWHLDAY